ncbi:dTMP kinase [Anaerovirgula multivorans]|uniref:Thymidylate kinase n=1 Tax=Anaerovirgula multivorans TaxID=312168 RepID=A0A239CKS2_9FIRM|nr:dTMP kinase [Anaerovirgula multivorans]SNS20757.1 dTMP kinase [Anaerovirgula multivorans]
MITVCIEGIDFSGKSTQCALLEEHLRGTGKKVKVVHFPRYETPVGALIKQWLAGEVDLTDNAAHLLYEADRYDFIKELEEYEKELDYLILDRFTLSNLAYMTGKGIDTQLLADLQKGLTSPDVTFVLDLPLHVYIQRSKDADRLERDFEYTNRVRKAYKLFSNDSTFLLDASKASPEQLNESIVNFIELYVTE